MAAYQQRDFNPVEPLTLHISRSYRLISDDHDMPLENLDNLDIDNGRSLRSREIPPSYGKPQRKKWVELTDILALISSLVLLIAAFITVSPSISTPWKLALTRQFQVLGFLLSAMNTCFLSIVPKVLVLLEARFGPSYLQNYDAVLRNSFIKDRTNLLWRGLLVIITIIPIALSLAYKEFSHGLSHNKVGNHTGSFYGFLPLAGLQDRLVGLTFFANTTVSFTAAIIDETYYLTADVLATVTSDNNLIEGFREDDDFWNYYLSQMHDPPDQYLNQPNPSGDDSKNSYLESKLSGQDLYTGISTSLLMNSFFLTNSSWMFFCFIHTDLEQGNPTEHANIFRQRALLHNTRRENCTGTWRITFYSIESVDGACNKPPLPDVQQSQLTNTSLALPQWYMTTLTEYLGVFTTSGRNNSHWFLPATCTIFAGMY